MSARYLSELSKRRVGWYVVDHRCKRIYYGVGDALSDRTLNAYVQKSASGLGMTIPPIMLFDRAVVLMLVIDNGERKIAEWLNAFIDKTDYRAIGRQYPGYSWDEIFLRI